MTSEWSSSTDESFSEEVAKLMGQGKRHLVCNEVVQAVKCFEEATRKLDEKYGSCADECGEAYLFYGKALLELARAENGVLGNAIQGVSEKGEESSDDDDDDDDGKEEERMGTVGPKIKEMSPKAKEKIREDVQDAMAAEDEDEQGNKSSEEGTKEDDKDEEMEEDKQDEKTDEEHKDNDDSISKDKEEDALLVAQDKSEGKDNDVPQVAQSEAEEKGKDVPQVVRSEAEEKGKDVSQVAQCKSEEKDNGEPQEAESMTEEKGKDVQQVVQDKSEENEKEPQEAQSEAEEKGKDMPQVAQSEAEEDGKDAPQEGESSAKSGTEEEAMEQSEGDKEADKGGEGTREDETAEGKEQDEESDDCDIPTMQLAWETCELARVVFSRQNSKEAQLNLAQVFLKLGEIQLEQEQFVGAGEDFKKCHEIQEKYLEPDDRLLAETTYNIGLSYYLQPNYPKAKEFFSKALQVIELRTANLEGRIAEWESKNKGKEKATDDNPCVQDRKELEDLRDLFPEVKAKIDDAHEMSQSSQMPVEETTEGFGSNQQKSDDTPVNNVPVKPVSNVGHLVRRKRKPDEDSREADEGETGPPKKARQEDSSPVTENGHSANGSVTSTDQQ